MGYLLKLLQIRVPLKVEISLLIYHTKQRNCNGMEPNRERFGVVNFFYYVLFQLPAKFPFPSKANKISMKFYSFI